MLVGLAGGLLLLYRIQKQPPAAPPPPPPPPRITLPPAPVLSDAELAKIREATKDADPQVRWAAVELLYRVKDPLAGQVLRSLLATDTDFTVKTKAIEALTRSGNPGSIEDVMVALKDPAKEVRLAALLSLGEMGDARLAPVVVEMLRDYEPDVRMQALHTMGRFQEKRQAEYQALAERLRAEYERSLQAQKPIKEKLLEERTLEP